MPVGAERALVPPAARRPIGWLLALVVAYAVAWGASRGCLWLATDVVGHEVAPLAAAQVPAFVAGFAGLFLPLLYLFASALAGRWLRPRWRSLVLTMGATFLCAMWLEVAVDSLFVALLGRPCWTYHVWPVHDGYTSGIGMLMWPMYAVFLHLLHQAIDLNPRLAALRPPAAKALLVAVDAMLLEVAANAYALALAGLWRL